MYHVTGSEQVASSLPMTTSIKKACVCTGCSQPELSRSLAGVTDRVRSVGSGNQP